MTEHAADPVADKDVPALCSIIVLSESLSAASLRWLIERLQDDLRQYDGPK